MGTFNVEPNLAVLNAAAAVLNAVIFVLLVRGLGWLRGKRDQCDAVYRELSGLRDKRDLEELHRWF